MKPQDPINTVILSCRPCQHSWRVQFPESQLRSSAFHKATNCPICHGLPSTCTYVEGTRTNAPCNSACRHATSRICRCSCAGANHGAAYDAPALRLAS